MNLKTRKTKYTLLAINVLALALQATGIYLLQFYVLQHTTYPNGFGSATFLAYPTQAATLLITGLTIQILTLTLILYRYQLSKLTKEPQVGA